MFLLTDASLSKRAKSSLRVMTSSWAVHWDARLVNPSMSAKRMLKQRKDKEQQRSNTSNPGLRVNRFKVSPLITAVWERNVRTVNLGGEIKSDLRVVSRICVWLCRCVSERMLCLLRAVIECVLLLLWGFSYLGSGWLNIPSLVLISLHSARPLNPLLTGSTFTCTCVCMKPTSDGLRLWK